MEIETAAVVDPQALVPVTVYPPVAVGEKVIPFVMPPDQL
jgi:hypothetical protein